MEAIFSLLPSLCLAIKVRAEDEANEEYSSSSSRNGNSTQFIYVVCRVMSVDERLWSFTFANALFNVLERIKNRSKLIECAQNVDETQQWLEHM